MQDSFRIATVRHEDGASSPLCRRFTRETAETARAFHRSFEEYAVTPLRDLRSLAGHLGVSRVWVKDESFRFGLNAFKMLGGSYAIGKTLAEKLGRDIRTTGCRELTDPAVRAALGDMTFITATDGNHGRGVAWTAARLGQRSVVFMPRCTAAERLENIRKLGSDASIQPLVYDDCVRLAKKTAGEKGWTLVQDTAWPGYEEIPLRIMEGYTTMALEALEQMGAERPTHIFLQAGVGSMPAALAAFFAQIYGDYRPVITVVEPNGADCLYLTAKADDGKLHPYEGEMCSIMAGLCCGEPCPPAWELLRACADHFVSMPDYAAAHGMRTLAHPLGDDPRVVSGESGAAGLGLAACLMERESLRPIREALGLGPDSRILCFSTEGDTDRENYRRIVDEGAYPLPEE